MTTTTSSPTIVLIAGHWLGAWAWDEVREHLETDGARAVAMTLPGLDGDDANRAAKTLDDQRCQRPRHPPPRPAPRACLPGGVGRFGPRGGRQRVRP